MIGNCGRPSGAGIEWTESVVDADEGRMLERDVDMLGLRRRQPLTSPRKSVKSPSGSESCMLNVTSRILMLFVGCGRISNPSAVPFSLQPHNYAKGKKTTYLGRSLEARSSCSSSRTGCGTRARQLIEARRLGGNDGEPGIGDARPPFESSLALCPIDLSRLRSVGRCLKWWGDPADASDRELNRRCSSAAPALTSSAGVGSAEASAG